MDWWALACLVTATAIWLDARRADDGSVEARGWALLALVAGPPVAPVYLWRRRRPRSAEGVRRRGCARRTPR